MSAVTTHVWLNDNYAPGMCRGCGVRTEGWGGKPGVLGIDREPADQYPLCRACGGSCCGDCAGGCEFGYSGSPSACSPEEKKT